MGNCLSATAANCCMTSTLACFACTQGGISKLQNKFAFFPPSPPTYSFDSGDQVKWNVEELARLAGSVLDTMAVDVTTRRLTVGKQQKDLHQMAFFHFAPRDPPPAGRRRLTMLWSHGNAMDAGELFHFHAKLAVSLGVNIATYDYSGYGASSGKPSEHALYANVEAAYEHLCSPEAFGVQPAEELVVYGQSVGSGPSVYLCARKPVRALLLHSGIASGIRVIAPDWSNLCSPVNVFGCFDIFPNVGRLRQLTCPVLLIHGTDDEVVHWRNSAEMHRVLAVSGKSPAVRPPLYVRGAGHNDVVEVDPELYMRTLAEFFEELQLGHGHSTHESSTTRVSYT